MSLRKSVATDLRMVRMSLAAAEASLESARLAKAGDMTPAEIDEARALLSGIRARVALEICSLETKPRRRVAVNG